LCTRLGRKAQIGQENQKQRRWWIVMGAGGRHVASLRGEGHRAAAHPAFTPSFPAPEITK
jgi:hypothetical protein